MNNEICGILMVDVDEEVNVGGKRTRDYLDWCTRMETLRSETPEQRVAVWQEALEVAEDSSLFNQVLSEIFDEFNEYTEIADDEPIFGARKIALKRVLTAMTDAEKSQGKVKTALKAYGELLS